MQVTMQPTSVLSKLLLSWPMKENNFKFIPTFADFHLQMRLAKVCCITMLYKSVCVLASLTDI